VSGQLSFFTTPQTTPAGLRYESQFISEREEIDLIKRVRELPLMPFQFGAFEGKRRVASFGWRYDYSEQKLQSADPLPNWITPVIAKVETFAGLHPHSVRQVLCTEYQVGVGIGWHRDKRHFDQIFGLSLASACRFRFRRKVGELWDRFTLNAEPRSLYLMSDEARHVWEHSVPPVEAVRYSITFRTMTTGG
jgi:alkylated DNA repair dioxygenase AlkB